MKSDLTNMRFGKLVVLNKSDKRDKYKYIYWNCLCDCGNKFITSTVKLKRGRKKSCGCLERKITDLTGQIFGNLTILTWDKNYKWKCICSCGKITYRTTGHLKQRKHLSCGCLTKSFQRENAEDFTNQKIGRITVFKKIEEKYNYNNILWLCKCDCGRELKISTNSLRTRKQRKNSSCNLGPCSYKWNNKLTNIEREGRFKTRNPKYTFWRKSVYGRDKYTCVICNQRGKIQAHHMNGYHWCVNGRYDINNGVTLCVKCHKKFHSIYSKQNNTRAQFIDFLKNRTSKTLGSILKDKSFYYLLGDKTSKNSK